MEEEVNKNNIWFGKDGNGVPRVKKFLSEIQSGLTPETLWFASDVGTNDFAKKSLIRMFQAEELFETPKPETLIQRIIQVASDPGDLVLDSFLGSGTTAAVAHKMGRRYLAVEMGDHAQSYCAPRLKLVVDGDDSGISGEVNWQGGGGFRFYRLGSPVFDEAGDICHDIKFPVLAAHVWFSETNSPWDGKGKTPFLGIHDGRAFALLYNGILGDKSIGGGNVLTRVTLRAIRDAIAKADSSFNGPLTVYGERTALGEASLARERTDFKQTPYDVKARR